MHLPKIVTLLLISVGTIITAPVSAQGWRPAPYPAYPGVYPGNHYGPPPGAYRPRGYPPAYPPGFYYAPYPLPGYAPTAYIQPAPTPAIIKPPQQVTDPTADSSIDDDRAADTEGKPASANHKEDFVNRLLPYIEAENHRLRQLRKRLVGLFSALERGQGITDKQQRDLSHLAQRYRVDGDPSHDSEARAELLNRIDVIPASMALAQAANESGWGRSRFATEANNLFGIWTYDKSKGLEPLQRDEDKTHLVRKFNDPGESIAYYMLMLNSHPAYADLRDIRLRARSKGYQPGGLELAEGLEKYSAKGKTYILLIQQLIEQNQWSDLDLQPPSG
jgi:Bax protein